MSTIFEEFIRTGSCSYTYFSLLGMSDIISLILKSLRSHNKDQLTIMGIVKASMPTEFVKNWPCQLLVKKDFIFGEFTLKKDEFVERMSFIFIPIGFPFNKIAIGIIKIQFLNTTKEVSFANWEQVSIFINKLLPHVDLIKNPAK